MPQKPKILVTSAAGHVGSAAVLELLRREYPVRAFVRRKDQRSVALEKAGAEIFEGDLRDYRDLELSLKGVQRAFFNPPFSQNTLYDSTMFAVAAEEAKLEMITLMGAWNLSPTHPSINVVIGSPIISINGCRQWMWSTLPPDCLRFPTF